MVVNKDIVEGLRNALSRGYSLEKAMKSFYNAGYKKEEVEDAARVLHEHPSHPMSHPGKPLSKDVKKPVTKPLSDESHPAPQTKPPEVKSQKSVTKPQKQLISKYEEKTKPKGKLTIILLLAALFVLLLVMIGAILFRKELINFFSNLF